MRLRKRCWSWLSMRTRVRRQWRDSPSRRTAGGGRRNDLAVGQNEGWGNTRVNLSRTFAIQRPRETQGGRYFIYRPPGQYSKHRPPPGSERTVRRLASSTTSSAALRLKSVGTREVLLLRACDGTSPKLCTSPPSGGVAAAAPNAVPPWRDHAHHAVCLPRQGCSPPRSRVEIRESSNAWRRRGARALCRRMSICSYNQFGDPTF